MNVELSRRAVACKHWRWIPGMKAVAVRDGGLEPVVQRVPDDLRLWRPYSDQTLPVFEDPATLGCLLHLVREAWGDNLIVTGWRNTQTSSTNRAPRPAWKVSPGALAIVPGTPTHAMSMAQHRTEAEALVAALEAAP